MDLKTILQKIDKIFAVLNLNDDDASEIEFIITAVQLSLAKTAEKYPDLKTKLNSLTINSLKTGDTLGLTDESKKYLENELKKIVDEYVLTILPTINDFKKNQIREVWSITG